MKEGAAVPDDGTVYRRAFDVCSVVLRTRGRSALASELEAAGTADEDIARAHAAGMQDAHRREACRGTFAALQEHQATNPT